ncbi:MAG TPA: substrate-binding domain-containing protein [Vicinamibacterales bacterium]|nr:substrate-binding domain-containing protein [Vicinamibacterales bacterium]
MTARPPTRRIALFYPWRPGNAQEFLRGIFRYARPSQPWEFCLTFDSDLPRLLAWRPAGIIGHFFSTAAMAAVKRLNVPAVNTARDVTGGGVPQVGLDDRAVGVLAAEYLLNRGFRAFAFVGDERKEFSRRTAEGFGTRLLAAHRTPVHAPRGVFQADAEALRPPSVRAERWLRHLPTPVAAFAAGDHLALQVIEAGRAVGRRVPEDLAVLGAGNIELLCNMAYPSLSSIHVAAEAAGYEAARLLARLMDGETPPTTRLEFPPLGVVTRRSTDVLAVTDTALANALRFIRERAHRPIGVADVARAALLSRSSLERRFRAGLGRAPAEEIRRVRLERARQLLIETDLAMPLIAEQSGFRDSGHLSEVFREQSAETPTAYRRRFRVV